jgi:deazaflavin-dependent oxidoreductase (nitroreductase family)
MSGRRYLKPPWGQRHIANRLVPLFRPSLVQRLTVPGRRTGRPRTVPVAVLEHGGERYLVSYRGESDWVRNIRASRRGTLKVRGRSEDIEVSEVPVEERPPLLAVYRERYGKMPTVSPVLDALPDPADHPIFRITRVQD